MQWRVVGAITGVAGALVGVAYLFVWDPLLPYVVGATAASACWLIYMLILETSGLVHKRAGVMAEEWTAQELRRLRRQGWFVVNHVMLEYVDVDHALLGPGGFIAVETKFRSDWSAARSELDSMATAANKAARGLQPRIGVRGPRVTPMVVMWGPGLAVEHNDPFEHRGVMFCPGHRLRRHVLRLPPQVADDEIRATFARLESYVTTRDRGELATEGLPPRTISQGINDILGVIVAVMVCALAVVTFTRVPPEGVWGLVVSAGAVGASLNARRRWAAHVRTQRITTAVITTAAGLGLLIITLFVLELIT
jgi:hypothetical protein